MTTLATPPLAPVARPSAVRRTAVVGTGVLTTATARGCRSPCRWERDDTWSRARGGIRTVAAGGAVVSPAVADRLGVYFASLATLPGHAAFPRLTDREREVLDLVARGHDNRRNHVSNVFAKLEVETRAEAVVRARNAGLGG